MKNILFSLFAIALAGVAAIAATTAMLNTPAPRTATVLNIGPPTTDKKPDTPGAPTGDRPATPAPIPDADKPAPGGASAPAPAPAPEAGAAKPAEGGAAKPAEAGMPGEEEKADEDPYEGIAPEDLPPDLQYDADSSVSFPTNI